MACIFASIYQLSWIFDRVYDHVPCCWQFWQKKRVNHRLGNMYLWSSSPSSVIQRVYSWSGIFLYGFRCQWSYHYPLQLFQRVGPWKNKIKDDRRNSASFFDRNINYISLIIFDRLVEVYFRVLHHHSKSSSSIFVQNSRRNTWVYSEGRSWYFYQFFQSNSRLQRKNPTWSRGSKTIALKLCNIEGIKRSELLGFIQV